MATKYPAVRDGDEFPVAARGIALMSGCLAAAALLILAGAVYGLAQLVLALLG